MAKELTFEELLKEEEPISETSIEEKEDKKKPDSSEEEKKKVLEGEEEDDDDKKNEEEKNKKKSKKDKVEEEDDDSEEDEEEEEGKEGEDERTFWDDVEKLTGRKIEVDYDGIDPESPEGAALREDAIERMAVGNFLQNLEKQYPREFRVLRHAAQGGKIEDLYSPDEPDYSSYEIPENDVEAQKEFLERYYTSFKKLPKDRARKLIEIDEDSEGGLLETAKSAVKEWAEAQENNRTQTEKQKALELEKKKKRDMAMVKSVADTIEKKTLGSFRVPEKEMDEFKKFAASSIQSTGDGYVVAMPLDESHLEERLQALYFIYKKGDLSKIIQTESKKENARRLRKKAEQQKQKIKPVGEEDNEKEFTTLEDLFN